MKHIDRLTEQQLNRLAALAQEWTAENITSNVGDNRESFPCWRTHKGIEPVGNYTPTTNGQQAMDLQKRFHVDVTYTYSIDEVHDELDESEWVEAVVYLQSCDSPSIRSSTPERAITLAVIASKWGTEIDEELLNG